MVESQVSENSIFVNLEDHLKMRKYYQSKIKELEFAEQVLRLLSIDDLKECLDHIKGIVKEADIDDISNIAVHSVAIVSALKETSVKESPEALDLFKNSIHDLAVLTLNNMKKKYSEWLAERANEIFDYLSAEDISVDIHARLSKYLEEQKEDTNNAD